MAAGENGEPMRGGRLSRMKEYVAALEDGDLGRMLELFRPRAKVTSPLEGTCSPRTFYGRLFETTKSARVRLVSGLMGEDGVSSAAHLEYDWTLADGTRRKFECVDLFRFDDEGRIRELKIFYDPTRVRSDYETVKSSIRSHR